MRIASGLARRVVLLVLLGMLPGFAAWAADAPEAYVRLAESESGKAQALQVALVHYRDHEGRTLDLVGAVHVGEQAYYRALNERFARHDAVLYELVADPDDLHSDAPRSDPDLATRLIGGSQQLMKNLLGLSFQLEEIDYRARNFVHADMTPDQMRQSMRDRNESWAGTALQMWAVTAAAGESGPDGLSMLAVLLAPDRQAALKRSMARSLASQVHVLDAFAGERGSTLVTERNRAALAVMERELAAGAQHLAIFYGAAHLPDFHRRLTLEHGFELIGIEWLDAWDLRDRPSGPVPDARRLQGE